METGYSSPRPDSGPSGARGLRWRGIFAVAVAALLVVSAALYIGRMRVATFLVQRYLNAYGIESEIAFDRLDWNGFLLRVRTGPSAAPDFAADGINVTLVYPNTGWLGHLIPQISTVQLIHPRLRVTYDGNRLSFGSLQSLVDETLAGNASAAKPAITIENGNLLVATPNGRLNFAADATVAGGRLNHLRATLRRSSLKGKSFTGTVASSISADLAGDALNVSADLKSDDAAFEDRTASGINANMIVRGLKWARAGNLISFTMAGVDLVLDAGAAQTSGAAVTASTSHFALEKIAGSFAAGRFQASAQADVALQFAGLRFGDASVALLDAQNAFSSLKLDVSRTAWSVSAAGESTLTGRDVEYSMPGRAVRLTSAKADIGGSQTITMDGASGSLRGSLSAAGILPGGTQLRSLRVFFGGSGAVGKGGASGALQASLSAIASVPHRAAADWALRIPGIGGDEAMASNIANALQSASLKISNVKITGKNDGVTVTAPAPMTLTGMNGAILTLRPQTGGPLVEIRDEEMAGAFGLDIQGEGLPQLHLGVSDYRYRLGTKLAGLDADTQFDMSADLASLRGLHVSGGGRLQIVGDRIAFTARDCAELALVSFRYGGFDRIRNIKGRLCGPALQIGGDAIAFNLSGCADVGFESLLDNGVAIADAAKARFCATAGHPVFTSGADGWRLQGAWTETSGRLVAAETAIANANGSIDLSGRGGEIKTGIASVDKAVLSDTGHALRFQPLSVSGTMRAAGANWQGQFELAASNRPLASVAVRHSMSTGAGEAAIDARGLAFKPAELQPASLAPFLASLGTRVTGNADFTGRVAWTRDGFTSSGRLMFTNGEFQSRFGLVRQAQADLQFSSLIPVTLRPDQTVTFGRVETIVPVEQVSARFSYTPSDLRLETATAEAAGGTIALDPLTYSFAPGVTTAGTLRFENIDPAPLIDAAGLSGRINVTARITGSLPFAVGPDGIRFTNGRLAAKGPGRLSIKREALTASAGATGDAQPSTNAVQDFAYQALENLAFDQLDGTVNSRPMGRLGLLFHIKGRNDPAQAAEARVGAVDLLRGRAFDKPVPLPKGTPIELTLDTSLNLDELLSSYFNRPRTGTAPGEALH